MSKKFLTVVLTLCLCLTLTAAMAESCPTQPPVEGSVQPVQSVQPQPHRPGPEALVTLHWFERQLHLAGISQFEIKLESRLTEDRDYVLELVIIYEEPYGYSELRTILRENDVVINDDHIVVPMSRAEQLMRIITSH